MPQYGFLISHQGLNGGVQVEADTLADAIDAAEKLIPGEKVIGGRQLDCQTSPPTRPVSSLWGGHR